MSYFIDLSDAKVAGENLYIVERSSGDASMTSALIITGVPFDISKFSDNTFDAILTVPKERVRTVKPIENKGLSEEEVQIMTDHPYQLKSSLKGGNRNFADYDLFQYNEKDFQEKCRVLKPGHFLVEFLPEENGDNYQYLFRVKDLARKAGFEYYAKVPWRKSGFVANTGRKSKDTEDICFFTKGRARELRPDAKKDKAEPGVEHFMSGANGMLPCVFDISPVNKKNKIHQSEKPVELLKQILGFITLEDELVLDQFAGSGVLGEAAFNAHRNSILIEKDVETFATMRARIEALGEIQVDTPEQQVAINIAVDALEAQYDGSDAQAAFDKFHKERSSDALVNAFHELNFAGSTPEQKEAVRAGQQAIQEADLMGIIPSGIHHSTTDEQSVLATEKKAIGIKTWHAARRRSRHLKSKLSL